MGFGRKPYGSQIRASGFSPVVERFPSFFHCHSLHSDLGKVQGHSDDAQARELEAFSILSFIFFIQIWLMNAGFEISSGAISSVLFPPSSVCRFFLTCDDQGRSADLLQRWDW